ncbi:MAG: ferrous iron transport protein A [Clostridia bacterium]|nr:ferrous iron transport protein A [Clostridia bacterium]
MLKLADLQKGQTGTVSQINTTSGSILRKLMSMGILPGVRITMIQTYPSYVFQAGFTQVAVDREIASVITLETTS